MAENYITAQVFSEFGTALGTLELRLAPASLGQVGISIEHSKVLHSATREHSIASIAHVRYKRGND